MYVYVCVCGGGGGVEVIHLFQTVWGREWGGAGEDDSLIQTALKNLANKCVHFGQFLILSAVV